VAGLLVLGADVFPLLNVRLRPGAHPADGAAAAVLFTAAAVYYFNSISLPRWLPADGHAGLDGVLARRLSYAGALAAAGALWALFPDVWFAPALLGAAIVLAIAARRTRSIDLWIEGQAIAFMGAVALAGVNFADAEMLGPLHRRVLTVLLVAAAHHALRTLSRLELIAVSPAYGVVHAWLGSLFVAVLVRRELDPPLVAVAWAGIVLALAAAARAAASPLLVRDVSIGALAACAQAVVVNIYGPPHAGPWWRAPVVDVGACAAILMAALPFARRIRVTALRHRPDRRPRGLAHIVTRRPDVVLFFAPLGLLVWLLAVHARGSLITVAWGFEAVAAFLLALWMRERSFRLGALGLLLACVLRIVVVDVWRLDQQGRYVAFIALGAALLLVSFLYSKYRDLLEEYL
jgi:hypothetical protein